MEKFKPATEYSESITWFEGALFNLSFSDNSISKGSLHKKQIVFKRTGDAPDVHGWGITHDKKSIIVTGNYSPTLFYLNPKTLKVEKTLTTNVTSLEDLAWDEKGIWASSFTEHRGQIFRISPSDGKIEQFFTMPEPEQCPVIDGIAVDGKNLWVTGKHCPSIYLVKNPLN